jgi:uncharacterized protein (DUF1778 family)
MTDDNTIITPMAKSGWIQIRVSDELKAAIDQAAKRDGRTVSNWLIWLASQHDPTVGQAAGIKAPITLSELNKLLGRNK